MLTREEKACNFETMRHIERVRNLLGEVIKELLERAAKHDQSKLEPPEVQAFTELTPKLAGLTFGSPEYLACKDALGPALEHHYANNRHHPEHFAHGVHDMTLVDLIEMVVDWKASSERHHDGNLLKSVQANAKRFQISAQLRDVLENTAHWMEGT